MSPHADAEPRRSRRVGSSRTVTQRRELLRLFFAGIAVKHVGYRNGPRVGEGHTWHVEHVGRHLPGRRYAEEL